MFPSPDSSCAKKRSLTRTLRQLLAGEAAPGPRLQVHGRAESGEERGAAAGMYS
ncbi:MAG: hypothetical protein U0235_25080 [Polyangiaceae bacterium]